MVQPKKSNQKAESLRPTICMTRDKAAVQYIIEHVKMREPCAAVGMNDGGKEVIYFAVLKELQKTFAERILFTVNATSKVDLVNFITKIKDTNKEIIAIINLATNEDVSLLIKELDTIRLTRSTAFTSVIITYIKDVYQGLTDHQKILVRSLYPLKPVDEKDANLLLDDFEKRFDFKVSVFYRQEIWKWAAGSVGLTKSLFMLIKDNPRIVFSNDALFKEEPVLYRLQTLINELPTEKLAQLVSNKRLPIEAQFFDMFGYTQNNAVFNKLLLYFLEQSGVVPTTNFQYLLSSQELLIFQGLRKSIDKIVGRDAIAYLLWKDQWEEKYSDWAIDQIMHRIRTKLVASEAPYELKTKKSLGFILTQE